MTFGQKGITTVTKNTSVEKVPTTLQSEEMYVPSPGPYQGAPTGSLCLLHSGSPVSPTRFQPLLEASAPTLKTGLH